jgi:hypothetical protein
MEIGGNEDRTRLFVGSNHRTVTSIIRRDGARQIPLVPIETRGNSVVVGVVVCRDKNDNFTKCGICIMSQCRNRTIPVKLQ